MRNNQPVTNVERHLADGEFIVSKTDLTGRIVYANRPFIEISGFDEAELLGQPHNIVRHPDMPREAFVDLWRTLKAGKPWRGMVKNRCKNGDHYWVEANAHPVWENGRIAGYMSLRVKASRARVEEAERIYREFREGRAADLTIHEGRVVPTGLRGAFARASQTSLATKVMASHAGIGAIVLGWCLPQVTGAWALSTSANVACMVSVLAMLCWSWTKLSRAVLTPLGRIAHACEVVSSGKLALPNADDRHDEVGALLHAIRTMTGNLASLVSDGQTSAVRVAETSRQITEGTRALEGRTKEQVSALEEVAACTSQISEAAQRSTEDARRAKELASSARGLAQEGAQAVARTSAAMGDVRESSRRIEQIVDLVDEIAFQTNLLALNASVEAARAGDQGRGFAVVAGEVRTLAQRCAQAAKEIRALIQDSATRVQNGTQLATSSGEILAQVVTAVNSVSELIGSIANGAAEAVTSIGHVDKAVSTMNSLTQQNAEMAAVSAGSATDLDTEAALLERSMGFFQLGQAANVRSLQGARPHRMKRAA